MDRKKIEKILLISPPGSSYFQPDGSKQAKQCPPPLGLAYLSAQISKEHDVKIYDMLIENFHQERIIGDVIFYGDTFEQYKEVLQNYNPDLIGVTCILSNRSNSALEICKIAKEFNDDIITVIGGHHATAVPEHALQENTDFVLFGEADHSFPELVKILEEGREISKMNGLAYKNNKEIIIKPQTNFIKELDNLPFPDWKTVGIQKYWASQLSHVHAVPLKSNKYVTMMSSRGCPHICSYCAVPKHSGKRNFRARSIENVVGEIEWLVSQYGVEEIHFEDDNFFANKNRVKELCKNLISNFSGMHFAVPSGTDVPNVDFELIDLLKKAGFHHLMLGIETGDISTQGQYVDKKIDLKDLREKVQYMNKVGLDPSGLFLIGFPHETREQVQRTVDLATSLTIS